MKITIADYIEPDLDWETFQFQNMGLEVVKYQLTHASSAELIQACRDATILIVNTAPITAEVVGGLEKCRLIIRHGVGFDNVDLPSANRQGILVVNVPDYCTLEVAEHAVMLILACQRKLLWHQHVLQASTTQGIWDYRGMSTPHRLHGLTLGIVGLGRIGGTVYQMVEGFGLNRMVCDPYLPDDQKKRWGITFYPLDELLKQADIITIHTPLNETTYHLFDEPQFQRMKPESVLVNTARGAIVNLAVLDQALRRGQLASAAVDVYEDEPPSPDFPLLKNEKVICTPHLAWISAEAYQDIRAKIVDEVRRFVNGERPRNVVNPEVLIQ